MAEYLSPGVYVEEYDSSPRAIEGVGTSTAGFVGMAVKGPTVGAPSLVTSFSDFQRQFGGYLSEHTHGEYRYLAYAVEQYFVNGGTRCFISRVIPEDAKIAEAEQGILRFRAANEGKWGNRIVITFVATNKKKLQLVKKEGDRIYTARSVAGFLEGDVIEFAGEYNRIVSIFENTITFEKEFGADPVDPALVPKVTAFSVEMDATIRYEGEVENYSNLSLNFASPNYIAKKFASSQIIVAEVEESDEIANPVSVIFGEGKVSGTITFSGGSDGSEAAVNAGTFIGEDLGPGKRTGIASFVENTVVSIIAVPGITIPDVIVSLVAHCENEKNRFAVIDIPRETTKTQDVLEYRGMIDSSYAAMYHPWIQVLDQG